MRRYHRATADVALAETISPAAFGQIEELRIHLDAASATAENLTVTLDAAAGAVYDTVLLAQDMNTVQDLHWLPARPINFVRGDSIVVAWPNTNGRVYGLEVVWSGTGV